MSQRTRALLGVQSVMHNVATNGAGNAIDISNYKTVVFQMRPSSAAELTVKFAGSYSLKQPNFGSASTATNPWFYVQVAQLSNDSSVPSAAGSGGIVYAGTGIVQGYEVNTNHLRWFCPIVSGFVSGTVSMDIDAANELS